MRVLIIQSHPNSGSFNASIAQKIYHYFLDPDWGGISHDAVLHSLYEEEFFPVLPLEELQSSYSFEPEVQNYIDDVEKAELIIFIHPDWWGQPPAILKGWLDRVFRPGVAYCYEGNEFEDKVRKPLLGGKKAIAILTTDQPYTPENQQYFEELWERRIFSFCGIECLGVEAFFDMYHSTYGERQRWLEHLMEKISISINP